MAAGARVTRPICPICGRDVSPRPDNPAFPFCSSQCKLVDLGRWFDGSYRVPGPPVESTDELLSDERKQAGHDPEEDG
jgi:hypothetical protein